MDDSNFSTARSGVDRKTYDKLLLSMWLFCIPPIFRSLPSPNAFCTCAKSGSSLLAVENRINYFSTSNVIFLTYTQRKKAASHLRERPFVFQNNLVVVTDIDNFKTSRMNLEAQPPVGGYVQGHHVGLDVPILLQSMTVANGSDCSPSDL